MSHENLAVPHKVLYDSYNPPNWQLIFSIFSMFLPLRFVGDS